MQSMVSNVYDEYSQEYFTSNYRMMAYAKANTSKLGINHFSGYPLFNGNFDLISSQISCLEG